MSQGGIGLLARTADDAEDPQTLRMVAGAIANLCGNGASPSHLLSVNATRFLFSSTLRSSLPHCILILSLDIYIFSFTLC